MKILCLSITLCTTLTLVIYTSLVDAQYKYIGHYTQEECNRSISSSPAIYRGYTCSGGTSCNTNLTFRSQYPYNTLSAIASLLGADPSTVSQTNPNYDSTGVVEWNQVVYVPVTCDCPNGWFVYRKNVDFTLYHFTPFYDIANNTFQGLTTCQILQEQYPNGSPRGFPITVPLRCACPTASQRKNGIKSLITYVVGNSDTISSVSTRLKVDSKSICEANDLQEGSIIYPFTTLLIPESTSSSSSLPPPPLSPSTSQPPEAKASALSKGAIGGIAAAGGAVLLAFGGGVAYRFNLCGCGSMFNCFNSNVTNIIKEKKKKKTSKVQRATTP